MIDTEFKIMTGIFFILLFFSSYKYTIIYLVFWIFIYLFGFFLTSIGLYSDIENLEKSEIIYKEYTGNYDDLFDKLSEFHKLQKKFKLNSEISPFGIFYDDPSIVLEINKCRSIYGIICKNKFDNKELKEYMIQENYKIGVIPESQCFNGNYEGMFSVRSSFVFLARIIIQMTLLKYFRRLFVPKWRDNKVKTAKSNYKKHCGVLIKISECKIDLYVPVENEKQFYLHSQVGAPSKKKK